MAYVRNGCAGKNVGNYAVNLHETDSCGILDSSLVGQEHRRGSRPVIEGT